MENASTQKYEPFGQAGAVEPPFRGYCENTHDALILFEAAKRGIIPRVTRRLTDREKVAMIKSGAVFVFDEHESNIKRWTDGMSWSPSRIYGNYLTYREIVDKAESLASPNAVGITATETSGISSSRPFPRNPLPGSVRSRPHLSAASVSGLELPNNGGRPRSSSDAQLQGFDAGRPKKGQQGAKTFWRPDGLVKRTISVMVNGYHQHLVSYYNPTDVHEDRLYRPRDIPLLAKLDIGEEYLRSDSFRLPIQTMYTTDGKLRYAGEPTSVPGQSNNQAQDAFSGLSQHLPPPASAPVQLQNVYSMPQQAYTFATLPKEAVMDHNSHSRPSTGASHVSVITPMSPITAGNYYDNYLEQEQQKPMTHTAPVIWHVPLPTAPQQRPHTTQFSGSPSMARQMSEGGGAEKSAARMRSNSRYQPYNSPDQYHASQSAMQLVLPGQPTRPSTMRRTPSHQNDQNSYVPMTPVTETVRNSPMSNNNTISSNGNHHNINNVVMLNSAELPMQNMQYSPTATSASQGSPHEVHPIQYLNFEPNGTAGLQPIDNSQIHSSSSNVSMTSSNSRQNGCFGNGYNASDLHSNIASSLPNQGWPGMNATNMPPQYMGIPSVKMEYVDPSTESIDTIPTFSRSVGGGMPMYQQSAMQLAHANGDNNVHAGPSIEGQWVLSPGPPGGAQSHLMMPQSYQGQQPMLSMGPSQHMVMTGWQTGNMHPVYQQERQDLQQQQQSQPQPIYYSHMPNTAQQ
ncbi:hypothetical protein QFC22_002100 [Naganishia vaughanmartiniae]|uniref:Uncharacterized protein n=1 Tax=Naganishia vaughanmartiniae TaxID=1424756 RepID=A0ACC2XDP8_9TREE|nr:hypothetical protein QFC22_002100 [Naganishia vaughanmartiniae]